MLNLGARDFRPQIGIIAPDGTFTPLPDQPRASLGSPLVSPDRTQFAAGPEVRDVETGEIVSTHGGIVVIADGNCMAAGPLSASPSTYQRICEGRVLSISPHGERVFTDLFTVVDVASGEVTTLPVPRFDGPRMSYYSLLTLTTFWEDEDHVVMLVPGENQTIFSFVRCEISTNTCERASDELHGDDPSDAPMELSPLD